MRIKSIISKYIYFLGKMETKFSVDFSFTLFTIKFSFFAISELNVHLQNKTSVNVT